MSVSTYFVHFSLFWEPPKASPKNLVSNFADRNSSARQITQEARPLTVANADMKHAAGRLR
jgi:hypothetical protein